MCRMLIFFIHLLINDGDDERKSGLKETHSYHFFFNLLLESNHSTSYFLEIRIHLSLISESFLNSLIFENSGHVQLIFYNLKEVDYYIEVNARSVRLYYGESSAARVIDSVVLNILQTL